MPVAVHCPTCGQELVAPDELIGQVAACPGCNAQFPISEKSEGQPVVPPPPPSGQQLTASSTQVTDGDPPAAAKPPARALPSTEAFFPPGKSPAAKAAAPPKPARQPARTTPQAIPVASTPRTARPARFIAGESTETGIELGQDGQLPMLVLTEGKSNVATDAEGQKSNPLLLVGVLCFSLLASLSMLLLDTNSYYSEPDSKNDARAQIEAHYVKGKPLREPYQELLAIALQAHHKGDYSEERTYYRQVLKMLREENKNAYTGVTGRVSAPISSDGSPSQPNDDHLDSLLRTLLR